MSSRHLLTSFLLVLSFMLLGTTYGSGKLEKVIVVHRHGIRTPAIPFPFETTDEWQNQFPMQVSSSSHYTHQQYFIKPNRDHNILPGNSFLGELTDSGVGQHVQLGRSLRNRYAQRLGLHSSINPNLVHIETTWKSRTIRSVEANLSGWFPNSKGDLPHIQTSELSPLFANWYETPMACPILKSKHSDIVQEADYKKFMDQQEPFRRHLANKFDVPLESVNFFFLHDSLACYEAEGIAFPKNLTRDEYEKIESIAVWEYNFYFANKEFSRLALGQFVKELFGIMSHNTTERLFLFSGHDMTIFPLLAIHSYFPQEWTTFASNMEFEIYNNSTVKIFYNQHQQLPIAGCGLNPCPLDVYFSFIQWSVPDDWKKECQVKSGFDHYDVALTTTDHMRAKAT